MAGNLFAILSDLSLSDEEAELAVLFEQGQGSGEGTMGGIKQRKKEQRKKAAARPPTPPAREAGSGGISSGGGGAKGEGEGAGAGAGAQQGGGRGSRLDKPLVWVDLEMTGLDPYSDTILEVAVIITDGKLTRQVEGPEIAVHQSDEVLEGMNEWCVEQHGRSGLTARCRESTTSLEEAEEEVLAFLQKHTDPGRSPIAGNTVHMDLAFLRLHMPKVAAHLHYRIVDVSSVKELAWRWFPNDARNAPQKVLAHTALSDIRESIAELKYLRKAVFK